MKKYIFIIPVFFDIIPQNKNQSDKFKLSFDEKIQMFFQTI